MGEYGEGLGEDPQRGSWSRRHSPKRITRMLVIPALPGFFENPDGSL